MAKALLNNFQKDILKNFAKTELSKKFSWSGGTLLSYVYLNHRQSLDLDFLSDNLFPDEWILEQTNKIKKNCQITKSQFQKKLNRWIFLFEKNSQSLKFELVYYPFPAVGKREINQEFGLKIDSLVDIATNKIQTIFERQEPKDVFDLYWILKRDKKMNLDKLFKLVEKKFGSSIDSITWSAKAIKTAQKISQLKPFVFSGFGVDKDILVDFFKEYSFKVLRRKIKYG